MWTYDCTTDNELYHHGVAGMKWGIRRYQTKSGSLTPAGKKRVKSASDGKPSSKQKSTAKANTDTAPPKKTAKTMSDEELRVAISRKRLENDYNTLYPEKVSAGKKVASVIVNKVIVPAAVNAGRQVAQDFLISQGKKALKMPAGSGGDSKK